MNRTVFIVILLLIGYFVGAKFPVIARSVGFV